VVVAILLDLFNLEADLLDGHYLPQPAATVHSSPATCHHAVELFLKLSMAPCLLALKVGFPHCRLRVEPVPTQVVLNLKYGARTAEARTHYDHHFSTKGSH
jgi:hypothetical protein